MIKVLGVSTLAAIAVIAVMTSTAQGKYLLLLNGSSVSELNFWLEGAASSLTAENGLKIECEETVGFAALELSGGGTFVNVPANAKFSGCEWVGSEKTCTINDEGSGLIYASFLFGVLNMPEVGTYKISAQSGNLATVYTEGIFCTIPEEEVIHGTVNIDLLGAEEDTFVKSAHFNGSGLALGNSWVTSFAGEITLKDENPSATFAIHLVGL